MDKRYVELLARETPIKKSKVWYNRRGLAMAAMVFIILGLILFMQGIGYSIAIVATGSILAIILAVFKQRESKSLKKDFLDYYEKHGDLPPWPEDKPDDITNKIPHQQ